MYFSDKWFGNPKTEVYRFVVMQGGVSKKRIVGVFKSLAQAQDFKHVREARALAGVKYHIRKEYH